LAQKIVLWLFPDGMLFHTVVADMQKARVALTVLVGGTVNSEEFDERRQRAG